LIVTYTVSDGEGKTDLGRVSINIQAPIEQHSQEKVIAKTADSKQELIAKNATDMMEKHNQIIKDTHASIANSQEIQKRALSHESVS